MSSQFSINITQNAADKVAALITEENKPNLKLRIYITGGGCSGFEYGFTFDEQVADDDCVIELKSTNDCTVQFLIDALSYPYLKDAEIDYISDIQGEQFVIRNPNAKTTCGCGSSFSMEEEDN